MTLADMRVLSRVVSRDGLGGRAGGGGGGGGGPEVSLFEVLGHQGRKRSLDERDEVVELLDPTAGGRREVGDDPDPVRGDRRQAVVDRARVAHERQDRADGQAVVLAPVAAPTAPPDE